MPFRYLLLVLLWLLQLPAPAADAAPLQPIPSEDYGVATQS